MLVQILYRAISEVKCFSLWETCKDDGSGSRTFFSLQVVNNHTKRLNWSSFKVILLSALMSTRRPNRKKTNSTNSSVAQNYVLYLNSVKTS